MGTTWEIKEVQHGEGRWATTKIEIHRDGIKIPHPVSIPDRATAEKWVEIYQQLPAGYHVNYAHRRSGDMMDHSGWWLSGPQGFRSRKVKNSVDLVQVAREAVATEPQRAAAAAVSEAEKVIKQAAWDESEKRRNQGLATDRQVDYIMQLLTARQDGVGGGFMTGPTTREEVRKMTKAQASLYIDSLTEQY